MQEGRDVFYDEILAAAEPDCPAEPLDAEHPLYILYTSGSTAKPKGILHTTGGYLTGVSATHRYVFDLKPDIGRVLVRGRRRLGHRALLHRLRAALQRRHLGDVGGRSRLPPQGDLVGARRALRRHDPVLRADGDPRVHQVGRGVAEQAQPRQPAAARLGGRADQPEGVAVVPQGDRLRTLSDRRHLVADRDRRDHDHARCRASPPPSPARPRTRSRGCSPRCSTSPPASPIARRPGAARADAPVAVDAAHALQGAGALRRDLLQALRHARPTWWATPPGATPTATCG